MTLARWSILPILALAIVTVQSLELIDTIPLVPEMKIK